MRINLKISPSLFSYFCIAGFVAIWWSIAFSNNQKSSLSTFSTPRPTSDQTFPQIFPYLSSMDRNSIHQALSGDVDLMMKLMVEWDVDAEILEGHGIKDVKRLQRSLYLKGQLLGRSVVTDVQKESVSILPQTYQSASFLMALVDPKNIIGIPKGMRQLTDLYPKQITDQIPQNIDFLDAETLFRHHPSLAIVSHIYTRPTVLQTLNNIGIPMIAQRNVENVEDIKLGILEIGQAINQQKKAEILSIFVEATMLAIDNRMIAVNHMVKTQSDFYATLYLNDYTYYSVPSDHSLVGQLLKRIGSIFPILSVQSPSSFIPQHSINLNEEQLVALQPKCLLLSSSHPESSWAKIEQSPLFDQLPAKKLGKIYFLNEVVQLASDQYIVLAYYDLALSLANAHLM